MSTPLIMNTLSNANASVDDDLPDAAAGRAPGSAHFH